ncbi:DUF4265 domain-containing protein [Corallococcus sp. AB011P]|nr:DUF4265 domain-containing protein [Corallococcus sp. AB011P]
MSCAGVIPTVDHARHLDSSDRVVLVEGLATGDEIKLTGEALDTFKVLKRGGNFSAWIFFPKEGMNQGPEMTRLQREAAELGGQLDGGAVTSLIFTMPASIGFDRIADFFDLAVSRIEGAVWMFVNAYDPLTKKPLDWWSRG